MVYQLFNLIMAKQKKEIKEETKEEVVKVADKQNPAFDPEIPEQKQRWLR